MSARLLVVHHSPTPGTRRLADAVLTGARDDAIDGVEVVERPALEADADDVIGADGIVLGTPANFGYMSGALKHFFDTIFLVVGGDLAADGTAGTAGGDGRESGGSAPRRLPYGLFVHGRHDTTGAVRSVEAIVGALGWRPCSEVLAVLGDVTHADDAAGYELGATIAALLSQ